MSDMLKIYVAGSSDERPRVRKWVDKLRLYPSVIHVTSKWLDVIDGEQHGVGNPRHASREDRQRWAKQNLTQASQADMLWFLVPESSHGRGGYFEAGWMFGDARDSDKLVYSGDTLQSVFCSLGHEFVTDEEAYHFILGEMGLDGG